MLLQLENTGKDDIGKLLRFAKQNNIKLSLLDEDGEKLFLPGKPLTPEQLNELIETGRKSGVISMQDTNQQIRSNYNAD